MTRLPLPAALRPAACAVALAVTVAADARAQTGPLRVVRIADGVHAVLRHNVAKDPSDANSLIIVNEHDVVVVDANITTSSSRRVIDEIRKLTPKPVRYVVNTHWHSDHHYGNQAYREAWPGVEFIAHEHTRADILAQDIPAFEKNLATDYPADLAATREKLARGTTTAGVPYTEQQKESLRHHARVLEWFMAEAKTFRPLPPDLTVADSLVLHRGDRTIVLRHLGRGNTRGDLVVWLPKERVLATGDLVVAPIPFSFGSFLGDWTRTLAALKAYPAATILPGHGELQRDWTHVDRVAAFLRATLDRTAVASAGGAPLDSVRKRVSLADFRAQFIAGDSALGPSFDYLASVAVERAWREARGEVAVAPADTAPARQALAVVLRLFDAMRTKDTAAFRDIFAPGAKLVGLRASREGGQAVQALPWEEFAAFTARDTRGPWIERAWSPEVRIRGSLATVWTEYDFHMGDKPSHCGVDAVQLLRTSEGWRIVSIADTYETECPVRPRPAMGTANK